MARFLRKSRFGLARSFTVIFGACSIAWAISSWSFYREGALLEGSAQRILSGENFTAEQLSLLKLKIDATPAKQLRALALNDVAVIRLQLVEHELTISNRQSVASDFADLETAVTAALAEDPNNSFLWLADYWLQDPSARAADRGLKFLHMSYLLGPNEAWIAVKRNPLALKTFSSLPSELEEQVVSEFVGLVRSGLYWDASNILAGSEVAVREKLLGELMRIREDNRVEFAKVLRRNLDDARVPGVSGPSSRGAF